MQLCDLYGLPDLDTSSEAVQRTLGSFIATLLSAGVSGLRIDAAKHVSAAETEAILRTAGVVNGTVNGTARTVEVIQETIGTDPLVDIVQPSEYLRNGRVSRFSE